MLEGRPACALVWMYCPKNWYAAGAAYCAVRSGMVPLPETMIGFDCVGSNVPIWPL